MVIICFVAYRKWYVRKSISYVYCINILINLPVSLKLIEIGNSHDERKVMELLINAFNYVHIKG